MALSSGRRGGPAYPGGDLLEFVNKRLLSVAGHRQGEVFWETKWRTCPHTCELMTGKEEPGEEELGSARTHLSCWRRGLRGSLGQMWLCSQAAGGPFDKPVDRGLQPRSSRALKSPPSVCKPHAHLGAVCFQENVTVVKVCHLSIVRHRP